MSGLEIFERGLAVLAADAQTAGIGPVCVTIDRDAFRQWFGDRPGVVYHSIKATVRPSHDDS